MTPAEQEQNLKQHSQSIAESFDSYKERADFFFSRFEDLSQTILSEGPVVIIDGERQPHPLLDEYIDVVETLQRDFGFVLPDFRINSKS